MIPPYQAATEEIRKQAQAPRKLLNTAIGVGTTLIGGSAITKVLPLLNQFVPGELMRKGLAKINPRIGGFIDTAINNGYSLDDIRNFLSEKFSPEEQESIPNEKSQPQQANEQEENQNPIIKEAQLFESEFPDIAQSISNLMKSGRTPQESAEIIEKSLPEKIKKIEKKLGKRFRDFINEIFGNQAQSFQPQQAPAQIQQQPQAQPQQPGQLNPQLAQIMNGIRTAMQNMSGTP